MLEIDGLNAGYGQLRVLRDVCLRVHDGDIMVILGANGAGKTTLLRAVSGLLPCQGSILFEGVQLARGRRSPARLGLAHVPQGRGTFGQLTVEENLRIGGFHRSKAEVAGDLAKWYDFFPRLGERRSQVTAGLSGGEQQMLAIARALMGDPKLLLLDEPSLGLAPKVTQGLFSGLRRIKDEAKVTMLIVEQNARLTLEIADTAVVMEAGRVGPARAASDMWDDHAIQRAYLGV